MLHKHNMAYSSLILLLLHYAVPQAIKVEVREHRQLVYPQRLLGEGAALLFRQHRLPRGQPHHMASRTYGWRHHRF